MHKIQQVKYTILSAIAISAILIASTAVAGMQSSQQAFAQNTNNTGASAQNQTGASAQNQTGASAQNQTGASAQNQTGASAQKPSAAAAKDPPSNKNFVWQGTVSSSPSKLTGHEDERVAVILPPRKDVGVYSGILTFHASKPVRVVVWNVVNPGNTTAIPDQFGKEDVVQAGKMKVVQAEIGSRDRAGSIPFTGNAVQLVGGDSDFTATYSVNALATKAKMVNNIESLKSFNATSSGGG
jgi:hypothetical protein